MVFVYGFFSGNGVAACSRVFTKLREPVAQCSAISLERANVYYMNEVETIIQSVERRNSEVNFLKINLKPNQCCLGIETVISLSPINIGSMLYDIFYLTWSALWSTKMFTFTPETHSIIDKMIYCILFNAF